MIVENQKLTVVSWRHPKADAVKDDKLWGGGFYLHGKVEYYYRYDLCSFVGLPEEFSYASTLHNENKTPCRRIKFTGIYPVEVLDYPGECLGFFWYSTYRDEFRGLIVDKTDFEALQYANEQYLNKEDFI